MAAVFVNNGIAGGKSQPGTMVLGAEVGVEYFLQVIGLYAVSLISDGDT